MSIKRHVIQAKCKAKLPKIRKRLFNVPGRPVISCCGTSTEKVSLLLKHHLKAIMQNGLSYIRHSQDFLEKIKTIKTLNCIKTIIADVVSLYPNIPHEAGLKALTKANIFRKITTIFILTISLFCKIIKQNYFQD